MTGSTHFTHLSAPRQALARLLQSVNFGYVEELEVRRGEPMFSPSPSIFVDVKLDADEAPRPEENLPNFVLREEVVRLMNRLDELWDGTIKRIEVRTGLPRRVIIERRLTEAPR